MCIIYIYLCIHMCIYAFAMDAFIHTSFVPLHIESCMSFMSVYSCMHACCIHLYTYIYIYVIHIYICIYPCMYLMSFHLCIHWIICPYIHACKDVCSLLLMFTAPRVTPTSQCIQCIGGGVTLGAINIDNIEEVEVHGHL